MKGENGFIRSFIDELHSWDIQGDQRENESGVTQKSLMISIRRMSNEIKWKMKVVLLEVSLMNFRSWDIQGDEVEGESRVTRSIIDELHSGDIQGDQVEGGSGVTRTIIDEPQSSDMQGD